MINPTIKPDTPVVYLTRLNAGNAWVTGIFMEFVTPGRTDLLDSVIVLPTDKRALAEDHHKGAVLAQDVYAMPETLILGELDKYDAIKPLLASPDHKLRELHVGQIIQSLGAIVDNYLVTL